VEFNHDLIANALQTITVGRTDKKHQQSNVNETRQQNNNNRKIKKIQKQTKKIRTEHTRRQRLHETLDS